MTFTFEQLPLAVQLRDDATFENFYAADNDLLLAQLRRQLDDGERYLFLYGGPGCGRSHLLQAACHQAQQQQQSSTYLPLGELMAFPPAELFEGLETLELVCLDDIDQVLGNRVWEQALFNLFNHLLESGTCLLVSAGRSVRQLDMQLEDLRSRLSWGGVFQLAPLAEAEQMAAVNLRAGNRGLKLSEEVLSYIYHRSPRDLESLIQVIDRLDRASLRDQRRLTIPFVKSVMGW